MASALEILLTAQNTASKEILLLQSQLKALNAQVLKNAPATDSAAAANARLAASFKAASVAGGQLTTILVGLGGIILFADAVRTIAEFEQSLAGVRAVIQPTEEQFRDLEDAARDLGATTVFSASQAAEGLEFLGRAGFTAEEALGAIKGTLDLAAAGSLELGRAADIASNVLSGFGLNATEAGRVADVLASSAANANTNVEQLGEGIKFVGPIAAAFGISIEDSAAALGTLSNAGLQASTAGTGLRRVLSTLGTQSPKLTKLLEKLGVSFSDINPATNDLTDVIERLSGTSLTAADALEVFGDRGAPAILSLISQVDGLRELNETLENSGGTAGRIADTLQDTLSGAVKELRSAFQELLLTIGDNGLGEALRDIVDGATGVIRVFTGTLDPLDENAVLYREIAEAVEAFKLVLLSLLAVRAIGFLGGIGTGLVSLKGDFVKARGAAVGFRGALVGLRAIALTALGPLGWIVGLGLALASFADNEAEAVNQKLLEIDAAIKLIDASIDTLTLGQLEDEAAGSAASIAELNAQLLQLDEGLKATAGQTSGLGKTAGADTRSSNFGFDDGSGEIQNLNNQQLQAQRESVAQQLAIAEAGQEAINTALEKARAEDVEDKRVKDAQLVALERKTQTALLDAASAAATLKKALLENELELAKNTSDEILAIELARLKQELEAGNLTTEQYYEGKIAAALSNLDAEIEIETRKKDEILRLQREQTDSLQAQREQTISTTRGDEQIAEQQKIFDARAEQLASQQAAELIAVDAALTELNLREQQLRTENTTEAVKAVKDRDKKLADERKKASDKTLADFEAAFDAELAAINTQADRRRAALERQRATGETTGFEADKVAFQIDQDQITALNALTNEFAELNTEVDSLNVKEKIAEVGEEVVNLNAKVGPELDKLNKSIDANLVQSFQQVIDGTLTIEDAFKNMIANVLAELASSALTNAVSGFGASLTSAFSPGAGGAGAGGGGAGIAALFSSFFRDGGLVRAAEGGYITGPGSGTSDSIPARLSDGEYVMKARAVQHYGPNFMEAINRMAVANQGGMKKFSITRPRRGKFAEGGVVDSGSGAKDNSRQGLRIINVVDTDDASKFLESGQGEEVVLNYIRTNGSKIKQYLK